MKNHYTAFLFVFVYWICGSSVCLSQSGSLILNSYSGQSVISASRSVTLASGFHAAGTSLRVYIAPVLPVVSLTPDNDRNYYIRHVYRDSVRYGSSSTPGSDQENRTVVYFDGFGRMIQTHAVGQSPDQSDLITYHEYDPSGRTAVEYLPYVPAVSGGGAFRTHAKQEQLDFYASPSAGIPQTGFPFRKDVFEPGTSGRITESGHYGAGWQPGTASSPGHTRKQSYGTNTGTEVRLWRVTATGCQGQEFYASGALSKTIQYDENNPLRLREGSVEEFGDLRGNVVLTRKWLDGTALDTYYVYDDYGLLRYVIPPSCTSLVVSESSSDFFHLLYSYRYDDRGRMTEKKVPGREWEFFVYNKLGLQVLSQDGNLRLQHRWQYSKYDAYGRTVILGLYTDAGSREVLQSRLNTSESKFWEDRTADGSTYGNEAFPRSGTVPLAIRYYDDYRFAQAQSIPASGIMASANTTGYLTGELVYRTDGSNPLLSVYYYDRRGNVLRSGSQHQLGGTVVTDNSYSFIGELISSKRTYTVAGQTTTIADNYTYDHTGRPMTGRQRINSQLEITLTSNSYNRLGQLRSKAVGADAGGNNPVNSTTYTYNERGWLTASASGYFSQQLRYHDPVSGSAPRWNGSISEQHWGRGAVLTDRFQYSYDAQDQLRSGVSPTLGISEAMEYSRTGDIQRLTRDNMQTIFTYENQGLSSRLSTLSGGAVPFSSTYAYDANGNTVQDRMGYEYRYNILDLPDAVLQNNSPLSGFVYDAYGQKLSRISALSGRRDYLGELELQDGAIDLIHTGEGYALKSGGSYVYHYIQSDHQGNSRTVLYRHPASGAVEVLQQDDYYPFGRQLSRLVSGRENKYLYNGKEKQDAIGNRYDYGARFYDSEIGRWSTIDPLSERHYGTSGYGYVLNNPVRYIDPFGLDTLSAGTNWRGYREDVDVYRIGEVSVAVPGSSWRYSLFKTVLDMDRQLADASRQTAALQARLTWMQEQSALRGTAHLNGPNPYRPYIPTDADINTAGAVLSMIPYTAPLGTVMQLSTARSAGDVGMTVATSLPYVQILKRAGLAAKLGVQAAKTGSRVFEVGAYNSLKGVEVGLDAHHAGQKALMAKFIQNYDPLTAPSILVPKLGHTQGAGVLSRSMSGFSNAREVLARDIFELRRVYPNIPNSSLQELIQLNKTMYPGAFIK